MTRTEKVQAIKDSHSHYKKIGSDMDNTIEQTLSAWNASLEKIKTDMYAKMNAELQKIRTYYEAELATVKARLDKLSEQIIPEATE